MTALKGNKREGKLMCHTNRQQSAAEERVFFIVLGRVNALNRLILRVIHFFDIGPDYLLQT